MSIVYRTLTSTRVFIMCEYYLNGGVCGSCCCNTRLLGLLSGPKRKEAIGYYVNQCFENKMITSLCTMSERIYFSPIFIFDFKTHTRCMHVAVRASTRPASAADVFHLAFSLFSCLPGAHLRRGDCADV